MTRRWAKEKISEAGIWAMAVSLLALGVAPMVWSAIAGALNIDGVTTLVGVIMTLALVVGVNYALINVPAQTIIQEKSPEDMRGRMFATQLAMANVISIMPLVFLGGLADFIGITTVVMLVAGFVFAVGLLSRYWGRRGASGAIEMSSVEVPIEDISDDGDQPPDVIN
jgi:MFS family permease